MRQPRRHPSSPEFDEHGMCVSAVDWLGNRFRVGDPVLYTINGDGTREIALGKVIYIAVAQRVDWTGLPYDEVTVQVLTAGTAAPYDANARTKPAWPRATNITAVAGLDAVALAKIAELPV